jgi:5-methylcytosine-specific restriction endonuclease McrA
MKKKTMEEILSNEITTPIDCSLCNDTVRCDKGDPILKFKDNYICWNCSLELIPVIYKWDYSNMSHLIFQDCLSSNFNRKRRKPVARYNYIFKELLHKYNFKCVECGCKENLTIDHIKPVSKGGGDEISNLQIMCKSCNSKKGNKYDLD